MRGIFVRSFLLPSLACALSFGNAVAQSFSVSTGSPSLTLHPGDSNVSLPVSVTSSDGYSGPVMVTLTGLPSGISVTPVVLSPGSSGTVFLTASVSADQEAFPATDPTNPDSATSTVTVLAYTPAQSASANLSLTVSLENLSFVPSTINLPIIRIDTGGVPIVDKTTNVPGTATITSGDGLTSYLPGAAGTDNTATLHIHGNSTALQPKKSYNLKLNTSADLLTGMGLVCPYVTSSNKPVCDKSKSYILLANYDDKTMLRDWAASALANAIPIGGSFLGQTASSPTPSGTAALMPWASHSLFVEVYLNGQYEGTYQLIEEVKIDSHRVNVTEMAETATSGSALTGGYLMEIDQRQAEDYDFVTPEGVYIGLDDPDYSPEVSQQTSYITNYVETAEAALFSSSYTDPTLGWRAYFDEASTMNFYLVNEILGNEDGSRFYSSDYLYKDKSNPLLYMGPVWDFDVSSGNVNFDAIIDPLIPWTLARNPWYARFSTDPTFMADAAAQWNALKSSGVLSSWLSSIDTEAAALQHTQQNNFGRWPMQGVRVWPNAEAAGSYSGELAYFKNWVTLRMGYIDFVLNHLTQAQISLTPPTGPLYARTPATMTAMVQGTNVTGTVTFSYNSIVLGEAPVDSTGKATLTTSNLPAGAWVLEAYYDGDSHNAIAGVGVSVSVLAPLTYTTTDLTSSAYTTVYGSSITLNSAVEPTSGSVISGGTMSFVANNNSLGSAPVSGVGLATFSTSALVAGSNALQVSYSGDATHAASTSNSITVNVSAAPATVTLGGLSATYDGNAHAATATTLPVGLTVVTTYNGSSAVPTAAGSYAVVATVSDPNYAGTASGTLIISAAASTVTLAGLTVTYDGNPHAATAITTPAGLSVSFTYNGSLTAPATAGSYAVVATVTDPNYTGATSGTLIISKAIASVALGGLSATYDGNPHAATATTTPSGLVVNFTYDGSATAPTTSGSYAVIATVNDPNYAGTASGTLIMSKAVATLALGGLSDTYDGNPHAPTATTTPAGLAVSFTYNGSSAAPSAAGSYPVIATVSDPNYAATANGTLLIGKVSPVISWTTPAVIIYGTALSAAQLDATKTVSGALSYMPGLGSVLGGGTQTLSVSLLPDDTTDYSTSSQTVELVVRQQGTTLSLASSSATPVPNQNVTFIATVSPASSGSPSGNVTFYDGTTALASIPLAGGAATYSTVALLSGSHAITAVYGGDNNYLSSQSTGGVAVSVAALDFTFSATGAMSQTVSAGGTASFAFAIGPMYQAYPGAIAIAVTGLPSGATYTLSPQTLNPAGGSQTLTLTIQLPQSVARLQDRGRRQQSAPWALALLLPVLVWGSRRRRISNIMPVLLMGALALLLAGTIGCGSSAPAPLGYPVTLTVTSGGVQHTATVALIVR